MTAWLRAGIRRQRRIGSLRFVHAVHEGIAVGIER